MTTLRLASNTRGVLKMALAFSALALSVSSLSAATLTYVGAQFNDTAWRTASDVKPFSTSGSNIYGKDGYRFFSSSIATVLPTYVSAIAPASGIATYGTYGTAGAQIDNPVAAGTIGTGTAYINGAAAGVTGEMFTFTLAGTVPNTIRISVLYDNTDGTQPNITMSLGLSGGVNAVPGGSASIVVSNTNQVADWYSFNIVGGVAGQSYSVYLTNSDTVARGLQVGGIAFDTVASAVPEPSTYAAIAGAVILGVAVYRRRKQA